MLGSWERSIFKTKFIFKRFDSSLTTKLCPFWLGLEQPSADKKLLSLWLLSSAFMALLSSSSSSTSLSSSSASVFYQLIFASYLSIVTDWNSKIEVHHPQKGAISKQFYYDWSYISKRPGFSRSGPSYKSRTSIELQDTSFSSGCLLLGSESKSHLDGQRRVHKKLYLNGSDSGDCSHFDVKKIDI